jgi:hypothetical protein
MLYLSLVLASGPPSVTVRIPERSIEEAAHALATASTAVFDVWNGRQWERTLFFVWSLSYMKGTDNPGPNEPTPAATVDSGREHGSNPQTKGKRV